jgi:hypothetical protein
MILVIVLGVVVRAVTAVIILIIGLIWFWTYAKTNRRIQIITFFLCFFICGQAVTNFVSDRSGSTGVEWGSLLLKMTDSGHRLMDYIDYPESGSWNVITESAPAFFMPLIAPVRGFFMMIAPMPLWDLQLVDIINDIFFKAKYNSLPILTLFQKVNALLFMLSIPMLWAAVFDTHQINRKLWALFPLAFVILVCVMGFSVRGMIEARYRPMLLLFWLVTAGIGFYYGRPQRYVIPTIAVIALGSAIYLFPKWF